MPKNAVKSLNLLTSYIKLINLGSVLPKNSDFFKQFDTDGDGYISFTEYLMIVTFLAIPLEARFLLWAALNVNNICF